MRVRAVRIDPDLDPDRLDHALAALPPAERERIQRYRRPLDRQRAVLGVRLARRALSEATGRPDAALDVRRDASGRPFLPGGPDWAGDFNVSHSGLWVVCAVVGRGRVGVDVQAVRPLRPGIARHCCSPEERDALARLAEPERLPFLVALWTLKEAVLKASGQGLAVSPAQVGFVPESVWGAEPMLRHAPPTVRDGWRLWRPPLDEHHALAVCADREGWPQEVTRIEHGEVLFEAPSRA